ncbi:hypothetical protein [Leptolyngbya sp. KIOST-1]|uniref:hypothetical protein n=1 Tax=Leptolyngbya sp. KIOST-1 TaxID=1229172 RepID=UPI00055BC243|nr:hypothetical protein [Leptolyngbya sp. KIOST-1]
MSTAETIYELVKTLPEDQADLVLAFTRFVQQQGEKPVSSPVPGGTLTGLRGIAKPTSSPPNDSDIADDYANYLIEKYQ